jgi:hypothetical protein
MRPIFETCQPREDILKGELRADIFAARLKDVIDRAADPIYGDANLFFENTFPTEGLRTLLRETLDRLTGKDPAKDALIRLETSFGGGKTHSLIALYHLATGNLPKKSLLKWLGDDAVFPKAGQVRVAGLVGSELDPTVGVGHGDGGIRTKTLWGEIAYQLGGAEGYAIAQESDELFAAPGTPLLEKVEKINAGAPTLVMIDELARYLVAAAAQPTRTGGSNLAEQSVAFLMSLLEHAASRPNVVVVLTLAGEGDAFAGQTLILLNALADAKAVSARRERIIRPTDEGEMPAIVVHRLFKQIDRKQAKETIERYGAYYQSLFERNADLPQKAVRAEFLQEFAKSYPFHPELLLTLDKKISTIPNFQRTRGALRLLAMTVRALWATRPEAAFAIHPYHLDLSNTEIAEDLTARLDRPRFKQVIEADVVSGLPGSHAHAQEIDRDYPAPYAQRLAATIFLHSLSQGIATGLSPAELNLAVLSPLPTGGDDPAVVQRALERFSDAAWFLEYDSHRYRLKTEPALNKIVEDEMGQVGQTKGKAEAERRIKQIWRKGFLHTMYFPDSPADVDDNADDPKLVIMHFDAIACNPGDAEPPDLVQRIMGHKGTDESFRQYPNNLVFLLVDADQVQNMVDLNRRYLGIHRILSDADRLAVFNDDQVKKLRKMAEAAELEARVSITRAYRYLYYPSADAPKTHEFLKREILPPQDQGEMDQDQTNVVVRVLRALKKVQTADEEVLSAQFVRSKAWEANTASMTTEELRRAFARKPGLRILLDKGQLLKTVRQGVEQGVWIYYDASEQFGYDQDSPPPSYAIGENLTLYAPDKARELGIRTKGKWQPGREDERTCPVCGRPQSECVCGVIQPTQTPLQAEGNPAKAFRSLADVCQENKVSALQGIALALDGIGDSAGKDLRGLALAVPQLPKGQFSFRLQLTASFGAPPITETIDLSYDGTWERYKRMRQMIEEISKETKSLRVVARLDGSFDPPLEATAERLEAISAILTGLEIDRVQLSARAAEVPPEKR